MERRIRAALIAATVALVSLGAFFPSGRACELGLGAFFIVAVAGGSMDAVHFLLLFFLMSLMRDLLPGVAGAMPSVKALGPLVVSTLLIFPFRRSETFRWMRAGKADVATYALGAVTAAVSIAALLVWARLSPNLGAGPATVRFFSARFPAWAILAFGPPLFALINALSEELVYRGLSQETIGESFGPLTALFLQSTLYGAAHFEAGFPNGYAGYAMTFAYGCVLGYMRLRTGGIKAPYLTHIVADLTIGYFLAFRVL